MPIALCVCQLAFMRRFQERFDEAETLLRRAMAIKKTFNPRNPMVLHEDLHLLGVILRHQGRWSEAQECYRETLRLREEFLAPEDLAIARISEDNAELLQLIGRSEEAHAHERLAKQIRDFHSLPGMNGGYVTEDPP